MRNLFIIGVLLIPQQIFAQSGCRPPSDAVLFAHFDLQRIAEKDRPYTRYLDLGNIPLMERGQVYRILSGHVNQLSRSDYLTPPAIVPGTEASLLRVNLQWYRWDPEVWEKLQNEDPYFSVRLLGKIGPAPWLSPTKRHNDCLNSLIHETHSQVPIVNAVWFHNQTSAVEERSPNYYDFLGGLKEQKDFWDLTGYDSKKAKLFGGDTRAAVAKSGVSAQPRAIARWKSYAGDFIYTLDFKRAQGQRDPLEVTGSPIEQHFDATEQYATLPNGLWAMFLADNKGKAQASAPGFVGGDKLSKSNDVRIHVPSSCIRCHGRGGLRSIDDYHRNLLRKPLTGLLFDLYGKGAQTEIDFRRQYLSNLEDVIEDAKSRYEKKILLITGWDSKIFAQNYSRLWEWFEDGDVDIIRASRDVGVSQERLLSVLQRNADPVTGKVLGPGVSGLLTGGSVPVRNWLSYVPAVHELLVKTP